MTAQQTSQTSASSAFTLMATSLLGFAIMIFRPLGFQKVTCSRPRRRPRFSDSAYSYVTDEEEEEEEDEPSSEGEDEFDDDDSVVVGSGGTDHDDD